MQKKERVLYYDLLNIGASFCVVAMHCNWIVHHFDGSSAWKQSGSMSIVGAGFPEFRSIAVFGGVFLFAWKKSNLWHGKQTFKHPPCF